MGSRRTLGIVWIALALVGAGCADEAARDPLERALVELARSPTPWRPLLDACERATAAAPGRARTIDACARHADPSVRAWTLVVVAGSAAGGDDDDARVIASRLEDPDPCVRATARHLHGRRVEAPRDRSVRRLLHALAGRDDDPRAVRPVLAADATPVDEPRVAAALALLDLGPTHAAAIDGLDAAARDASVAVRRRAAAALGKPGLPRDRATATLTERSLTDADVVVRTNAALSLAFLAPLPDATRDALRTRLDSSDVREALAVATALHADVDVHARDEIARALARSRAHVDAEACRQVQTDAAAVGTVRRMLEATYATRIRMIVDETAEPPELAGMRYRPIRPDARFAHLCALASAFSRYAPRVLRDHLDGVWIVRALFSAHGTRMGGTYIDDAVVIATEDPGEVRKTLHHEFSSILMYAYDFPEPAWRAANAEDFAYGWGGHHAIRTGRLERGAEAYYAAGFVEQYGQSDVENDVNTFTELVLDEPDRARTLIEKYPRLRAKWKVWASLYRRIDPGFTETHVFGRALATQTEAQ